ncbi:hypothetical protein [Allomesorhizobium camelthorni]|uniref:Uncharacterized protein n=1 Tax=Allomesorhizobium camelthorni TaxID=475069 RepID=A0A6G4WJR7_9HYPH|nr:hypothetical protein [Mesorhizobium camelthorni]NGO54849.1 hypothetical protein [Mesorhizobium camelthorni]
MNGGVARCNIGLLQMRKRIKQNLATHGLKPQKRRDKSLARGNEHLAEQIRKILRKHYANKYRVR